MSEIKNSIKVILTDGFFISPTILLGDAPEELEGIIVWTLDGCAPNTPVGVKAARLVHELAAFGAMPSIANTPYFRTYGGTLSALRNREFWPESHGHSRGVLLVNTVDLTIECWGGIGIRGLPEFDPNMGTSRKLERPRLDTSRLAQSNEAVVED